MKNATDSPVDYDDLYRAHHARVLRLCRLLLSDPHEADDVSQEVFLKLLRQQRTVGRSFASHASPPRVLPRPVFGASVSWATAAAALILLVGFAWGVGWWVSDEPVSLATRTANVSAFAADVSAALFATNDATGLLQLASDAPDLQAALEAGWPCTQARFLNGECDDQVSALFFEGQ